MDLTFREGKRDDVRAVAQLHADSWRRTYRGMYRDDFLDGGILDERKSVWAERLANNPDPRRLVLLAERDAALIGFICAYGDEHPHLGSLVDNLHVAYEHQRSGIGRALMRRAAEWLAERHPDSGVYLGVLERNERAIRFYEALGGRRDGPHMAPSADGTEVSAYHMLWESPAALVAGCGR
jgi:ribosomal protein S18 acetylase RimI-like enzyme